MSVMAMMMMTKEELSAAETGLMQESVSHNHIQ